MLLSDAAETRQAEAMVVICYDGGSKVAFEVSKFHHPTFYLG
jgi:hypothetical protein